MANEVEVHSFPTAQALLSLERICAAFSHGSLGSLSMTEDDMPGSSSPEPWDDKEQVEDTIAPCTAQENPSSDRSINVIDQSTSAHVSSSTFAHEDSDATPTRKSIAHASQGKLSMLPLLKVSRPISSSNTSPKQGIHPPRAPIHPTMNPDLLMVRPLHLALPGLRSSPIASVAVSNVKSTQSISKQALSSVVVPNDARIPPPTAVRKISSMTTRLTQPLRIAKKPSPLKLQTPPTRAPSSPPRVPPPSKTQAAPPVARTPQKPRTSLSRMSAIISTRIRGTSDSKVVLGSTRVLA